MWKRLLVPHDFSQCAARALDLAAGVARLLLGSVAEKVIWDASVLVITVRSSDEAPRPTREEALAEDELTG